MLFLPFLGYVRALQQVVGGNEPIAFLSRLNQKSVVQALSLYSIFGCLESTDTSHTLLTPNS